MLLSRHRHGKEFVRLVWLWCCCGCRLCAVKCARACMCAHTRLLRVILVCCWLPCSCSNNVVIIHRRPRITEYIQENTIEGCLSHQIHTICTQYVFGLCKKWKRIKTWPFTMICFSLLFLTSDSLSFLLLPVPLSRFSSSSIMEHFTPTVFF